MNKTYFGQKMSEIYAAFGRAYPGGQALEHVFERVRDMPDLVMDMALAQLQDEEKLPANLGRYIVREVAPGWQAQNRSREPEVCCPQCRSGMPGWRLIYAGLYGYRVKCVCAGGLEDWQIAQAGYSLAEPIHPKILAKMRAEPEGWAEKHLEIMANLRRRQQDAVA